MKSKISILIAGASVLASCVGAPELAVQEVGETRMVVTSAGANVSTMRTLNGVETSCVRLGPDATSDVSNSLNLISVGDEGGADAASDNEVEMIGRTPVNALMRDTLFHLCTLRQSQMITQEEYTSLLNYVLSQGFSLSRDELAGVTIDVQSKSANLQEVPDLPPGAYAVPGGTQRHPAPQQQQLPPSSYPPPGPPPPPN
jgi:hypothetical protein